MPPHDPPSPPAPASDENPPSDDATNTQAAVDAPAVGAGKPTKVKPKSPLLPGDRTRGLALLAGGLLPALLLMASDRQFPFSVSLVVVSSLVAGAGLLRLLGAWPERAPRETPTTGDFKPLLGVLLCAAGFVLFTSLAVKGVYPLPKVFSGTLITAAFIALVVACFRFGRSLGYWGPEADGVDRPLLQRHGFWLLTLSGLLYLPWLGNFGLIDPWETHYGEVAREMIARDDWVSLWWAHDGWFWSKPILNFWLQGLSFKVFGVNALPDQMIGGITQGYWPQPEWACRLPVFFLTVLGAYTLYRATVGPFGRRAAFLGGLVLATCPYWYILARQTMADMPYVAPLCAAMGFLMLGVQTAPDQVVKNRTFRLGKWSVQFNGFHVLFLAVLLSSLPQIVYLFTRNLTLHSVDMFGFRPHLDEFMRGSGGGNCGQPGNKGCTESAPIYVWGQPVVWATLWLGLQAWLVFYQRRERRLQRLLFLAGWLCTAFAVMAKGAPGLVLPLATVLAFLGTSGRWRDITRLELPALLLLVLVVALPWYVQMYMRHGYAFFDRLIMHDMVNRAFAHVHDTNKGDDVSFRYYVWQLGYGLFPWTGLCAAGLVWWAARREQFARLKWEAIVWLACWWLLAFGMFSITLTKFHHYIFPLVPPTAAITGVLLAELMPKFPPTLARNSAYFALLFLGTVAVVLGIVLCLPGSLNAFVVADQEPSPSRPILGAASLLVGLCAIVLGCLKFGPPRRDAALGDTPQERTADADPAALLVSPESPESPVSPVASASELSAAAESLATPRAAAPQLASQRIALAVLCIAAASAVALAGRDMFITRTGDVEGQVRLMHLFTYNYERLFPKSLDFKPVLLAFTVVGTLAVLLLALPRVQRHAATLVCTVAIAFSAWCINVYLVKLTPHWGQRETLVTYYQQRKSPEEKLVAYQMNWKGENFYTGNRMATWVSSGAKFKEWIKKQREKGVRTMFFTTEHTRANTLKKELDSPKQFEILTDDKLNNKFFLAKVTFDELAPGAAADAKTAKPPAAKPGAAKPRPSPSAAASQKAPSAAPANTDKPD
jgi:4-amino-4-deoxy-L-arabinose transferase-like glycosyltransferase